MRDFSFIITQHLALIRSVVYRYNRAIKAEDIDDVVQEVILKAYESIHKFNGDENDFKYWILNLARKVCYEIAIQKSPDIVSYDEMLHGDRLPAESGNFVPVEIVEHGDVAIKAYLESLEEEKYSLKWSGLSRQKSGLFKLLFSNIRIQCIERVFGKSPFTEPEGLFPKTLGPPPPFRDEHLPMFPLCYTVSP